MTQHNRAKSSVFTPSGKIQFGIFFQGVNSGTIWKAAESGSQTDFESFRRIAQTAERGLFAAFFLGEGLRLREHLGRPHALDVVGRPDAPDHAGRAGVGDQEHRARGHAEHHL